MTEKSFIFSVIMPVYNSERYLPESIDSIISQTFVDYEVIFVDDNSSDRSLAILQRYAEHYSNFRILRTKKNSGPSIARNIGIEASRGRYIAFLDSDDVWLPYKLELQYRAFAQYKAKIVYGDYDLIDERGFLIGRRIAPKRVDYKKMLHKNYIGNCTAAFSRKDLETLRFRSVGHEDYALWLEALRLSESDAISTGLVVAKYRVRSGSLSSNKFRGAAWVWTIYRKCEKLSLLDSIRFFICYLFISVKDAVRLRFF